MTDAAAWKAKGNEAFSAGDFPAAIEHFTKAIELDGSNHVLWSNRSAAQASLKNWAEAKKDAEKCVSLKSDWAKGYLRLGAAQHGLSDYDGAIATYQKGLEIEPTNASLKEALDAVEADAAGPAGGENPFSKIFGPDTLAKVAANPRLQPFLAQQDYVQMIQTLSANPQLINAYIKDQRIMQTFMELSGIDLGGAGAGPQAQRQPPQQSRPAEPAKPAEKPKKEEPPKTEAQLLKEEGNAFYKKREFEKALEKYNAALALEPQQTVYMLNRTAVYFETGDYDKCLAECESALEHGQENKADYQTMVKIMTRKAACLQKKKDYVAAIDLYKKALLEWRNPDTLAKLDACEKEKKKADEEAYLDPEIAKQKKDEGNAFFKEQKYPEAVACYTEAIKRNPNEHTVYSNRAACFNKLGAFADAIKDCDKCISLKPDFVRVYSRKGTAYLMQKQYNMALQAFDAGLKLDAENEDCKDGKARTLMKIQEMATGGGGPEDDQEDVARRAMADPEIQAIMGDSYMQLVLSEMQKDPKRIQEYMADPNIGGKINKLITAGILRFGGPAPQQGGGARRR